MKKIILIACAILTGTLSHAQLKADVEVVVQTQSNWCWAANSECILNYYGKPTSQCEINDYAWSKSNCCSSPGGCNKTNKITGKEAIEGIIDHFGQLKSTFVSGGLTTAQLEEVLSEKRPFVVGCKWNSGGGHVVVGCAYDPTGGTITMMDPWENNGMTTSAYSKTTVKLTTGSGTWSKSLIVDNRLNVGIDNTPSNASFNVYPSPGNGLYNIELLANGKTSIEVFNILGEVVYQENWNSNKTGITNHKIDISIAPKGNYFVSVRTGSKNYNKLIIKN